MVSKWDWQEFADPPTETVGEVTERVSELGDQLIKISERETLSEEDGGELADLGEQLRKLAQQLNGHVAGLHDALNERLGELANAKKLKW